ncbi:PREDICTED: spermatogenesis-associated protein 33 isoform X2 [Chinchilla lanigera]|uniref:spermatogenesis-associated protein 33 isoform X2 n=1 Tax=Chinchilla lanigera TaxID=34839 RepID=UPI0006982DD3|nr:PREDICTED: spermatogenesis-associated protein 33 isoform X2 [Chinchilla lanigera]
MAGPRRTPRGSEATPALRPAGRGGDFRGGCHFRSRGLLSREDGARLGLLARELARRAVAVVTGGRWEEGEEQKKSSSYFFAKSKDKLMERQSQETRQTDGEAGKPSDSPLATATATHRQPYASWEEHLVKLLPTAHSPQGTGASVLGLHRTAFCLPPGHWRGFQPRHTWTPGPKNLRE